MSASKRGGTPPPTEPGIGSNDRSIQASDSLRQTPRGSIRAGNLAHARATPEEISAAGLAQTGAADGLGSMETAIGVHASAQRSSDIVTRAEDSDAQSSNSETDPHNSLLGVVLAGRYQVIRKIGQGGMGAVYEAKHLAIGKRVAVKVLLEKFAKREAIIARLEQEARLATSIGHEHIIDINDFGNTEDGRTFVVMEYLEGESLAECLHREQQLPEQRILLIASQAASALAAAHDKGVIHRDVKPENLFLMRRKDEDFVKVVDFGISKSLRSSDPESIEHSPRLTQTGMVLGTPLYMSPEQARGDDEVDAGVDIYALGVIMYEASTGRVPFIGSNYLSVISQVLSEEAPAPRTLRPELSEEFEAIVLRSMAKNRNDRYATAADLLADIQTLLGDPKRSTERARITAPKRAAPALAPKRNATKIIIWAAAIAVLIGAVAVTVTVTMGGSSKNTAVAATPDARPVVVDAAVNQTPDASATPEAVIINIESEPSGAQILEGDAVQGETPFAYRAAKNSTEVIHLKAKLEGYEDAELTVRPFLDMERNKPIKVILKRVKKDPRIDNRGKNNGKTGDKTIPIDPKNGTTKPAGGGELGGFPSPTPGSKK
jgi:eukaryotic-like serine/threonine-protein kinase